LEPTVNVLAQKLVVDRQNSTAELGLQYTNNNNQILRPDGTSLAGAKARTIPVVCSTQFVNSCFRTPPETGF
jgi:hypothetical protein